MFDVLKVRPAEAALYIALKANDRPFPSLEVARILERKGGRYDTHLPELAVLADAQLSQTLVVAVDFALKNISVQDHVHHLRYPENLPELVLRYCYGVDDGQLHRITEAGKHFRAATSTVSYAHKRGLRMIYKEFGLGLLNTINPAEAIRRQERLQGLLEEHGLIPRPIESQG